MKSLFATSLLISLIPMAAFPQDRLSTVEGPALFKSYCAACHGSDAKGSGPMAKGMVKKVPDLTKIASTNRGKFPLDEVQKIIRGDTEYVISHGSRLMPVWGPVFSQVDNDMDLGRVRVFNLAKYIESLQTK